MHIGSHWSIVAALLAFSTSPAFGAAENELTPAEKDEGYNLLFDGKTLRGWHRNDEGYGGWTVEEGAICLSKNGGMLYTDGKYDNFVLKIDFKMSKGCNSGVFLRVGDPRDEVQTGLEVQVLDDFGRKPNHHSCGSFYDLVAPSKVASKPADQWNTFVITADKNLLTVELNSEKVAHIDVDQWTTPGRQPDGQRNKFRTAVKNFPRVGLIGLQDHGRPVAYKNIKLKPLK